MIRWSGKVQHGVYMILILVLMLVGGTYISNRMVERYVILNQKAMIGRLYEMDPVVCEEWLRAMFEDISDTEIASGNAALLEFGYTQEGMDYLFTQSELKQIGELVFFAQIALAGGIFICVWIFFRMQEKSMERKMSIQASAARELSKKETKIAKEMAQKFVENIAHQIKTPLACISISLDMLMETLKEEHQREKVQEAFFYLKQIEVLMKRLMDIGRLEAGKLMLKKEAVSLEEMIHSCVQTLASQNKRIVVEVAKGIEHTPVFYGDYDWLKEAFTNILKNSLEHDALNGEVSVKLRYQKELIYIQIRDHGTGIREEDINYIFDRFYIPNNAKNGHTGIGLNLAKLIIEKHFGTIEVVNHEEGGALFSICFPLYGLKNKKM